MGSQHQKTVDRQQSWRGISHGERLANYEKDWSIYSAGIQARIHSAVSMGDLVHTHEAAVGKYCGFIPPFIQYHLDHLDLGRFSDERPPHRLVVLDGRYVSSVVAPSLDALIDIIARCVDPDVDCIVEFGSGLGFNLARLRLRLPTAPLTYIACEPSASGRQATKSIFGTDPAARLQTHFFDYCQPNLDFLSGFRKIVAFTSHSIEQVPVLGESFYQTLLGTNIAACVHIEPVGWQRFTNISETVLALHRDKSAWDRFYSSYKFVLDDTRVVDNAAIWSTICGYNTDLLRIISAASTRGEISITTLAYDAVGLNPFNPSTVVAWRRNRVFG
jgi:hypothetical protein